MTVKSLQRVSDFLSIGFGSEIGGEDEMDKPFIMPTKSLEREAILPAKILRQASQKKLLELVTKSEKTGVIVNDDLAIAMLSWDKYEELVDVIEVQNQKIHEYEDILDDLHASYLYGDQVNAIESGDSEEYVIHNIDDMFKKLG